MPDHSLELSLPLQRAAQIEQRRIDAAIARIDERLTELDAERSKLRDEKNRLRSRQSLLEQIVDPHARTDETATAVVLRGSRLRTEAARLLMQHAGPGRPMHYRELYGVYRGAGFVVLGKRPEAAFLTAIGRSPVVRRGDEPGTYYIDPSLAVSLDRELAEVRAEVEDLESVIEREADPAPALREYRVKLIATRRRLEGQAVEADAVLAAEPLGGRDTQAIRVA
jgi:hypothetical protein